uniref:Uncharacterized protein n=1 Tax=Odontella aurita TaxID=265563 RepID=A0A7S4KD17_9STRA|mmetsp:Transcript_9140/g.27457  ORF Transcript_9140/g.27457 Transcript_9140/m.27457 type:complete len:778 (+) Transcript_9140:307-2640(+)
MSEKILQDPGILRLVYSLGFHAAKREEQRKKKLTNSTSDASQQSTRRTIPRGDSGVENAGVEIALEEFSKTDEDLVKAKGKETSEAEDLEEAAKALESIEGVRAHSLSLTIRTDDGRKESIRVQSPVMSLTLPPDFNFSNSGALGELITRVKPERSTPQSANAKSDRAGGPERAMPKPTHSTSEMESAEATSGAAAKSSDAIKLTVPPTFNVSDSNALGELISDIMKPDHSTPSESDGASLPGTDKDDSTSERNDVKDDKKAIAKDFKSPAESKSTAPFYESDVIRNLLGLMKSSSAEEAKNVIRVHDSKKLCNQSGEEEYYSYTAKKLTQGWLMWGKEECSACGCPLMIPPEDANTEKGNMEKGKCVNEKCDRGVKPERFSHSSSTDDTEVETWTGTELQTSVNSLSANDKSGCSDENNDSAPTMPPKPEDLPTTESQGDQKAQKPCPGGSRNTRPPMPGAEFGSSSEKQKENPPTKPPRSMPPIPGGQMSKKTPGPSPDCKSVCSRTPKKRQQQPRPDCGVARSNTPGEMLPPTTPDCSKSVRSRGRVSTRKLPPRPGDDCKSVRSRATTKKKVDKPRPGDSANKSVHSRATTKTTKKRVVNRPRRPEECAKSVRSRAKSLCTPKKRVANRPRRPEDCAKSLGRSRVTSRKSVGPSVKKPPIPGGGNCGRSVKSRRSRFGPPSVVGLRGNGGLDDDKSTSSASDISDLHEGDSVVTDAMSAIMDRMNVAKSLLEGKRGKNTKNASELARLVDTLSSAAEAVKKLEQLQHMEAAQQ